MTWGGSALFHPRTGNSQTARPEAFDTYTGSPVEGFHSLAYMTPRGSTTISRSCGARNPCPAGTPCPPVMFVPTLKVVPGAVSTRPRWVSKPIRLVHVHLPAVARSKCLASRHQSASEGFCFPCCSIIAYRFETLGGGRPLAPQAAPNSRL
jgi:hypothetical protein